MSFTLGTIKTDRELGRRCNYQKFIYQACPICGKTRWIRLTIIRSQLCRSCSGKTQTGAKNSNWKGGYKRTKAGYISRWLPKDDFFYPMTKGNGRILEHRLVMAQHLKRHLLSWEVVHHKNGIKDDNRLENLTLIRAEGQHNTQLNREIRRQAMVIEEQARRIEYLEARVTILEAERVLQNV